MLHTRFIYDGAFAISKSLMHAYQTRVVTFSGRSTSGTLCARCNICTVTGEGTQFWNMLGIHFVLAVFHRGVSITTMLCQTLDSQ